MENPVETLMKEKFLCPNKFAEEIEKLVLAYNFNYIDAILTFCEENKIEMESVSKLISKPLKEKLKCDACLLYTSPSQRDRQKSRMPSSG